MTQVPKDIRGDLYLVSSHGFAEFLQDVNKTDSSAVQLPQAGVACHWF
jgi:hypothetical protein